MDVLVLNRPHAQLYRRGYRFVKRVFDLTICLVFLPLAIVVMAIISLMVFLDSPGPIFFAQERIGCGERRFRIYKFRTMKRNFDDRSSRQFMQAFVTGQINQDDGGDNGAMYKPKQEDQITRVGRILRRTSLDELPQIFNVLRGEMSLVGPRPNVPWEVEVYRGWHNERLEVLPGITGLAQVRGRSDIPFDDIVQYDVEYIEKRSFKLDFQILWWTVLAVVIGKGAG
jgi:lipopolysaccharide/colanic/teichoic acid biosynthesis glycosyltransferase